MCLKPVYSKISWFQHVINNEQIRHGPSYHGIYILVKERDSACLPTSGHKWMCKQDDLQVVLSAVRERSKG